MGDKSESGDTAKAAEGGSAEEQMMAGSLTSFNTDDDQLSE